MHFHAQPRLARQVFAEQGEACSAESLPAAMPRDRARNEALGEEILRLVGHGHALDHRLLTLIAEFDAGEGWADGITRSCAHWLGWQCGFDLASARERVRTARALGRLPLLSAAMARGALSYAKLRALTRVATPANEGCLLEWAEHCTAQQLERMVRSFRRAREGEALEHAWLQQQRRALSWQYEDDGSLSLRARLPAEAGRLVLKALERAMEAVAGAAEAGAEAGVAGQGGGEPTAELHVQTEPTPDAPLLARRADALQRMAEGYLSLCAAGQPSRPDHHLVVVHVDVERLAGAEAGESGRCEYEDGSGLAAETARRLACDGALLRLTENAEGEPLDIGRRSRAIPPALRRALAVRDRGCRFPGCHHTQHLHAHHIRHWAEGGETRLDNLLTLCSQHHRAVHEGGLRIERLDDGALRWARPDGRALPERPPATRGCVDTLLAEHAALGLAIDACTAAGRWSGETPLYDFAVDWLLQVEARERRDGARPRRL